MLATTVIQEHVSLGDQRPEDMQAVITLLARAESLDHGAESAHPMVATAYRRRAAELKFAAWIGAIRTAPVTVDDVLQGVTFGEAA